MAVANYTTTPLTTATPTITSSSLYDDEDCDSTTYSTTTFTTTYTYCAPAADKTTIWDATYTIVEVVCGVPDLWVVPTVPPNFVTSVVQCNNKPVTITCPATNPAATQTATVTIHGNGVTATVVPPAPVIVVPTVAPTTALYPNGTTTRSAVTTTATPAPTSTKPAVVVTAGAVTVKKSLGLLGAGMMLVGAFVL